MFGLYEQPLQVRLGQLFLFLPIPQFFSATSLSGGEISFLSPGGLAAAPGFTHNWLTRLQRGREPVPLVSFPYPVPKTAQRAAQGRVLVFSPERAYPSPFRGRGWVSSNLARWDFNAEKPGAFPQERQMLRIRGLLSAVACGNCRPQPGHTGPTGPVRGFSGVVSLPGSQNRTQGRTGASLALISFSWCA